MREQDLVRAPSPSGLANAQKDLRTLSKRLSRCTGWDEELNFRVWWHTKTEAGQREAFKSACVLHYLDDGRMSWKQCFEAVRWDDDRSKPPNYTESLEAVVELLGDVLPGWRWLLRSADARGFFANVFQGEPNNGDPYWSNYAKTPAISLLRSTVDALFASRERTDEPLKAAHGTARHPNPPTQSAENAEQPSGVSASAGTPGEGADL